jgi:hypothetical protein
MKLRSSSIEDAYQELQMELADARGLWRLIARLVTWDYRAHQQRILFILGLRRRHR